MPRAVPVWFISDLGWRQGDALCREHLISWFARNDLVWCDRHSAPEFAEAIEVVKMAKRRSRSLRRAFPDGKG